MQARQMEGISLFTWWKNLGLQARFMVFTSIGLLGVALSVMVAVGWFEVSRVEEKLRNTSDSELKSLNALVSAAMEQYAGGTKDVALTVFNRWFDHRNVDYPGKLWSVWSPQMAAFMAQTAGAADVNFVRISVVDDDVSQRHSSRTNPVNDLSYDLRRGTTSGCARRIDLDADDVFRIDEFGPGVPS